MNGSSCSTTCDAEPACACGSRTTSAATNASRAVTWRGRGRVIATSYVGRTTGAALPRSRDARALDDEAALEVRGEPRERERHEEEGEHHGAVDLEGVHLAESDRRRRGEALDRA